MLVSWNWLKEYVDLDMEPGELAQRLSMAGLNHESTEQAGDDLAIDLEVTSNRPDWLGHVGVAREIAVLWDRSLRRPAAAPKPTATPIEQLTKVTLQCPELCNRYTARLIRGVRIGASPDWLVARLNTVGVKAINNVVDITNYVMLECGQPLHAFDFARLAGPEIIVRASQKDERFLAIDHRTYTLPPGTCVIADQRQAVALGGVMGGADSEVSATTKDVLIEAAQFEPLAIRTVARALNLHSPSSYRFERGVDPQAVDWASRRCCQLILELAGGELVAGVLDAGEQPAARGPIVLRLSQLKRTLGIEVPAAEVQRILAALGLDQQSANGQQIQVIPPSWRLDLSREIDLVEEVGRIYGYDRIPEDVGVPMAPSHRRLEDQVLDRVRNVVTAAGFDEAITTSVISEEWSRSFSPWTDAPPLRASTPLLHGADRLRRSLVPSLLDVRRHNQSVGNTEAELFEIARIYLPQGAQLPVEQWTLGLVSGRGFLAVKGVIESLVEALHGVAPLEVDDAQLELVDPARCCQLRLGERRLGFLGELAEDAARQFGQRGSTTIAELDLAPLLDQARLVPQYRPLSAYPATAQDINFIVQEQLRWADLQRTVWQAGGRWLEEVQYRETHRDPKRDGPGQKRLLVTITLRASDRTLTGDEANAVRDQIVRACMEKNGARIVEG